MIVFHIIVVTLGLEKGSLVFDEVGVLGVCVVLKSAIYDTTQCLVNFAFDFHIAVTYGKCIHFYLQLAIVFY